jgi:putative acetyltransferase
LQFRGFTGKIAPLQEFAMNIAQARPLTRTATIRPIRREDNAAIAAIIRTVLPEYAGTEPGTVLDDPEVDRMYETYAQPRSAYVVAERDSVVIGGSGVAPLKGGDAATCELQKMYLLKDARGQGLGQQLIAQCLAQAKQLGFARCYIETFTNMDTAQELYRRNGFTLLDAPLGATGHFRCNRWYAKEL